MSQDVRLLLVAAVGIGVLAWCVSYSSQIGNLVTTSTTGYGNIVKALEPNSGGMQTASTAPSVPSGAE
jgi:hypothetical protein